MTTLALGPSWLDPEHLLNTYSIWGLLLVVFAESGLLIGFFLPGDSLLFTCGLLITTDALDFPLWAAIALICLAAILGDQAGYMFGKKVGPSLFNRPDSKLFKQENVTKAHEFFEKYGAKSLVLARFVPIVRTFTPIVAGVSGMRYRSFLTFNVIGGVLWGAGVTLLGSWLGKHALVRDNIEAMLILIVLVSVVPIVIEYLRARGKSRKAQPAEPQAPQRPEALQRPQAPQYRQQPVMDDATTRLRRIEPEEPYQQSYQQPHGRQPHVGQSQQEQQHWNQGGHDDPYYDQRQYPQQQSPQDQYSQQQYGRDQYSQQQYDQQQHDQQQYGQEQYGQEQYDQQQYDQEQYGQQQYDQEQYPYDHRRQ
ncbi:membrane protein [Streptomyces lucensis JCM 4490]|uniref:Membrane protein n=1 Tax=Streptomyces lucensis JCM 4490 TaxID=1306176 RepID=A0A918J8Q9_9ACTN|nr:VTT domain-containing protein [Streptomyces lucensis]GGW61361.1 membrane protein [Streptomyces lucensis JCM 4490]